MFDTLEIAHLALRHLRQPIDVIATRDADLARQLRRAATSVPLNVAEGRQRSGKDRTQHYRVAAGSASEVTAALRVAVAWGYVADADVAEALAALDRVRAMLWRLTH